jgi:5'-methylthioadenosine phosphorylase
MATTRIGIIGGSGLYRIDGLTDIEWRKGESAYGEPSDELCFGRLEGTEVVFLPRHGRQHIHPPEGINYRANIDALKRAGVTDILSLSAVGGLQTQYAPGSFVLVDQFIDRTVGRDSSFFGTGCVAHVSMAHPVCARLASGLAEAGRSIGVDLMRGGTYLAMEGPQFSSFAESEMYRRWGAAVIGMTNMPEAKLAREAEICYATVAMVTDYDCWHPDHDHVTVDAVIRVLNENADRARRLVKSAIPFLARGNGPCASGCDRALEYAVLTPREGRDPAIVGRLQAVAGRVLNR